MKRRVMKFGLAALLALLLAGAMAVDAQAAEIMDSGACGDNLTWTLDYEGLLTISGTGEMYSYNFV